MAWYEQISRSGEAWILEAPNPVSAERDINPVGVMTAIINRHLMEPHVYWFDWATERNKVETVLKFLTVMRFRAVCLIHCRSSEARFFDHIAKYKILRRIGTVYNYYGAENAVMFQTKGFTGETL